MSESMPSTSALKKVLKPPRPDKKVITVTEDDFVNAPEVVGEEDFVDNEEMQLVDPDDFDIGTPSGAYEAFSSPKEMQEMDVVEAMTFSNANGIEGGVTLQKKRERKPNELNEDCVIAFQDNDLGTGYGSFDGLGSEGGKGAGALASAKTVEVLPGYLIEAYQKFNDAKTQEDFAKLSLVTLDIDHNQPVSTTAETYKGLEPSLMKKAIAISEALKRTNEDVKETGGKTTACFTLIHMSQDGKRYAITANIGDSGALLRRKDGSVVMITKEDSALNQLKEAAKNRPEIQQLYEKMKANPTEELLQGKSYEYLSRANTQALGGKEVFPNITITELQPGEEIYNVTDGILDFFETEEGDMDIQAIRNVLSKGTSLKERIEALREVAVARSKVASFDDTSKKDSDDSAISAIRYAEAA